MSDATEADESSGDGDAKTERERIREKKRRELRERLGGGGASDGGGGAGDSDASAGVADSADSGAGRESASATPGEPIAVNGIEEFQRVIGEHAVVLVDCYADWCGPCQMMEPAIEAIAAESEAAVAKVDVDANPEIAQRLGARSIPTLLVYANGEAVERFVGARDRATLESAIDQYAG